MRVIPSKRLVDNRIMKLVQCLRAFHFDLSFNFPAKPASALAQILHGKNDCLSCLFASLKHPVSCPSINFLAQVSCALLLSQGHPPWCCHFHPVSLGSQRMSLPPDRRPLRTSR